MSRAISKYPGTVPRAHFINHDNVSGVNDVGYIISGENFDDDMTVQFWDFRNGRVITARKNPDYKPQLSSTVPKVTFTLQGRVRLGPGLYQLLLENPGLKPRPQPAWIFIPGRGVEVVHEKDLEW